MTMKKHMERNPLSTSAEGRIGETHDIEEETKYKDVELKAEITNFCKTGNCRFCSAVFRPVTAEAGTKKFLENFSKNLDEYLSKGGRKIILTGGGDPLDAPAKLFGALREINKQIQEKNITLELLTIYSNGVSILKTVDRTAEERIDDINPQKETYLDVFEELGVTDINLSISGLTKEQRTEITGKQMGNIDINKTIKEILSRGIRVMTRSTLVKGGIDDLVQVTKFTDWMSRLGVQIVYFSDLFNVPKRGPKTTPGNQNALKWTDEHRIDFDELVDEVKKSESFEFVSKSKRHSGQGMTFEFKYRPTGTKVIFGSLDIGNEPAGANVYGYLKPDGTMSGTNNADESTRDFISIDRLKQFRPARDDWET